MTAVENKTTAAEKLTPIENTYTTKLQQISEEPEDISQLTTDDISGIPTFENLPSTTEQQVTPEKKINLAENQIKINTAEAEKRQDVIESKAPTNNKEKIMVADYFDPPSDRTDVVSKRLILEKSRSGTQWMSNINVRNRTDEGRNKDSEKFMESRIKEGSIIIDIGSALGNSDPKYAGICVEELYQNQNIVKKTDGNIIATDLDFDNNKAVWERHVQDKTAYNIKTEWVSASEGFMTPVESIVQKYGTDDSPVVIRAANSIDILMTPMDALKHFQHIAETLKTHKVTYMFNEDILYKPANSTEFSVIGKLNDAAFDHQTTKWKYNLDRIPYFLNEKGIKIMGSSDISKK